MEEFTKNIVVIIDNSIIDVTENRRHYIPIGPTTKTKTSELQSSQSATRCWQRHSLLPVFDYLLCSCPKSLQL